MNRWQMALASGLAGAGLVFLLDPASGARRRARVRDRAAHVARAAGESARRVARDLHNREHGLLARVAALLRAADAPDPVVCARVRAALGRLTMHAGAIETLCHDGRIELAGEVTALDHDRIVRGIGRVRGVRGVVDRLAVQGRV